MVQYCESFFIVDITTKNSNSEIGNYNISQIRSNPFEEFLAWLVMSSTVCTGRVAVMLYVETISLQWQPS